MALGTIEEAYEYRMKYILRMVFAEIKKTDVSLENVSPKMFFDLLDEHKETLGRYLIEDMIEWMSEGDWLRLVRGG